LTSTALGQSQWDRPDTGSISVGIVCALNDAWLLLVTKSSDHGLGLFSSLAPVTMGGDADVNADAEPDVMF